MRYRYIFMVLCALCCFSCAEVTQQPNPYQPPESCQYTTPKCSADGTQILTCYLGMELAYPCSGGCSNGICKQQNVDNSGCTYQTPQCSADAQFVLTCLNGVETQIPCAFGCENGVCKGNTQTQCTDTVAKCSLDGQSVVTCVQGVETQTPCALGCENGTCKVADEPVLGTCQDKEPKCSADGRHLITCVDGMEQATLCEHGCDAWAQACYDLADGDDLGTACRLEEDPYCQGDALIYCAETAEGIVWVKQDAPQNFICGEHEGMTMLLEKCSKAGTESTICSSSMQLMRVCTNVDGQLLYLPDYFSAETSYCSYGCANNSVCATEDVLTSCQPSTFTESCTSATSFHQCMNNIVRDGDCEGNKVCIIDSNKEAICGESCTPQNAPAFECLDGYSDDGKSIKMAVPVTCVKNPVVDQYGLERAPMDNWIDCPGACSTSTGCR